MEFNISTALSSLRQKKKLTQKTIAEKLGMYGFDVNQRRISDWENGISQPSIQQFIALCDILDVDDIFWEFAGIHRGAYAGLNEFGRQKAHTIIREITDMLFHIDMYRDEPEESEEDESRILRLYDIPVSAGFGNLLDSDSFDMIEVPGYVPDSADFALRVSGNSMEPLFQDGQIIWIKSEPVLNDGEIGVFEYYQEVYCKKIIISEDGICLRSLNEAYDDIEINEELGFHVIGKVVA